MHAEISEKAIPTFCRRLSIFRLLIICILFLAFLGFVYIANRDGSNLFAIPAVACLAFAIGVSTRFYRSAIIAVFFIAEVSRATTGVVWDGGLKPAQIRIILIDEKGMPVPGVSMSVARYDGAEARNYPIFEFQDQPLRSDSEGVIVCHQKQSGIQYGGYSWRLFWCIPMGFRSPQFYLKFEHIGYKPASRSIRHLLNLDDIISRVLPSTEIMINGMRKEVSVLEHRIMMQPKNSS